MTLLEVDIANALIALGYGTYNTAGGSPWGIDIWPNRFPLLPINCYMIKVLSLRPPSHYIHGSSLATLKYPKVHIEIRHTNEMTAKTYAEAILDGLDHSTISGYVRIDASMSAAVDVTNDEDLVALGGPYRFITEFDIIKNCI